MHEAVRNALIKLKRRLFIKSISYILKFKVLAWKNFLGLFSLLFTVLLSYFDATCAVSMHHPFPLLDKCPENANTALHVLLLLEGFKVEYAYLVKVWVVGQISIFP